MRALALAIIAILRAAAVVVGGWQIVTLQPVLDWLANPGAVPMGHWLVFLIKVGVLAICVGVFVGLGKLRRSWLPRGRARPEQKQDESAQRETEEFARREREFEESVAAQLRDSTKTS